MVGSPFTRWVVFGTLALSLEVPPLEAGTNAGFQAALQGPTLLEPVALDQIVDLVLDAEGVTHATGLLITAVYDPRLLAFEGFTAGTLIPELVTLPALLTAQDEGRTQLQGGGALLGGTPASGSGSMGTLTFRVIAEIPPTGAFISISAVQINASATDTDQLRFDEGEFGLFLASSDPVSKTSVPARSWGDLKQGRPWAP